MSSEKISTSIIVWNVIMINIQRMMFRATRSATSSSEVQTCVHCELIRFWHMGQCLSRAVRHEQPHEAGQNKGLARHCGEHPTHELGFKRGHVGL